MERPSVPPAEQIRFRAKLWTRWVDEDNQAVLNNAVYLTLLEESRHRYFSSLGLLEDNRFPFLLAQCNVRYLQPGRGGIELTVEVITTRLGRSSLEQASRIIGPSGCWAEAESLLVCVGADGRPTPMTAAFRAAVEQREGLASTMLRKCAENLQAVRRNLYNHAEETDGETGKTHGGDRSDGS